MNTHRLSIIALLLLLFSTAWAQNITRADNEVTVLTVSDVTIGEDGTFDLVINMDFNTTETIVGWNFSLLLPDGVDFNTTKTTAAARKKCCDFGELIDEDIASECLTIQERPAGGYLFNWIDQADKTPLLGTKGRLISINLKADPATLSGTGKIFGIGLSNSKDQGFATFGGGAVIADVEFNINAGTTPMPTLPAPTFSRVGNLLYISTATEGANIYYTLDGTVPTSNSTRYTNPITPTQSCTVKAIAVKEGFINSDVASFYYSVDSGGTGNEVTVLTASDVTIGEDGTFDLVINMDFNTTETIVGWNFSLLLPDGVDFNTTKTTAAARKKCCDFGELIDEDIASECLTIQERPAGGYLFNWIDQADKTPLLGTKGRLISINLKADPATLSGTGKIFGIGLSNSKDQGFATFGGGAVIADVEFNINAGTTPMPTLPKPSFSRVGNLLYISSTNEGANIYYTLDGTVPTSNSTRYTGPISPTQSCTVKAVAVKEGFIDSEVADFYYIVSTEKITVLTASDINIKAGGIAELVINMDYDTNETVVGWNFSLKLPEGITFNSANTAISAIKKCCTVSTELHDPDVAADGLNITERPNGGYLFTWIDKGDKTPLLKTHGKLITIQLKAATNAISGEGAITEIALSNNADQSLDQGNIKDASFYVNVEASSQPQEKKNVLIPNDVNIKTGSTADLVINMNYETDETVVGWNFTLYLPDGITFDTESSTIAAIKKCCVVSTETHDSDVAADGLTITERPDGGYLFTWIDKGDKTPLLKTHGKLMTIHLKAASDAVTATGTIKQIALSNQNDHSIDQGNINDATFTVNVTFDQNMEYDKMVDNVVYHLKFSNRSAMVKSIVPNGVVTIPANVVDGVFSYAVTAVGESVFGQGNNFSYVVFPESITSISEKAFQGDFDLYNYAVVWESNTKLPAALFDTQGFKNSNFLLYVKSAGVAPSNVTNVVVNLKADNIVLKDGQPFRCPIAFTAGNISFTHNFIMETGKGECGGWESIVLPFDVQTVTHQTKGELTPFATYKQGSGKKPFWLYELNAEGKFAKTAAIKALKPCIVSMPNNDSYPADYNVAGRVTFAATNVTVSPTINTSAIGEWAVAFAPVAKAEGRFALNVVNDFFSDYGSGNPGSRFINNLRNINPFELYCNSTSASREIAIEFADESSGIEELMLDNNLPILYKIYDAKGALVRSVVATYANAVSGLTPGLYLVNGVKVVLK